MRTTFRRAMMGITGLTIAIFLFVVIAFNSRMAGNFLRKEITRQASLRYGVNLEIGLLSPHLFPLSLEFGNVTASSQSSVSQTPFLRSKRILIGVRYPPLLRGKVRLSRLIFDEPVVRLQIDAQGRNNFSLASAPASTTSSSASSGAQALFDVKIGDCAIRAGELFYKDAQVPLNAAFHNLQLVAVYSLLSGEYTGSMAYDQGVWSEGGLAPISHSLRLEFTADPSTFSVSSLRLTTGASAIALKGRLSNYADPNINATYQLDLAMRELRAVLRKPTLPLGQAHLDGTLAYHAQPSHSLLADLNLQGKVRMDELALRDVNKSAKLVGIRADYEMKEGNLKVRNISAGALGGSLQASADCEKIDSPAPVVSIEGALHKLSLATISDAFAPPSVQRIPLVGSADLSAKVSWAGLSQNWNDTLVASGHMSVSAPAQVLSAQAIPLQGSVAVDYNARQGVLSFAPSYLQTKNSRLSISGTLAPSGSGNAMMAINASTGDLRELVSVAVIVDNAMSPTAPLAPLPNLGGSASFAGTATGTLQAPRLQGTLTGQKLSVGDTHWRSLRADLTASPSQLAVRNASLAGNAREQVTFNGQAGLQNWSIEPGSPIALQASVAGVSVSELAGMAQFHEPVTGAVTANVSLSGTRAVPKGTAMVNVVNGSAWNEPFAKLVLDGTFADGGVNSAVNLQAPVGNVSANVSYTLATQAYTLRLQGTNLQLDRIENLAGKNIHGAASLTADGSGTLTNPRLEANLNVPQIEAQGQTISNIAAKVNLAGQRADVSVHSTVDRGSVEGTGDITLGGDYFTEAQLDVKALPIAAVAANFLPAQSSKVGGQTEIHLTLRGPLSNPAAMEGRLQIPSLNVTFGAGQLALEAPLEANYRGGILTVSNSKIQGTGTNLTFGATIPLKSSAAYSLSADGSIDLGVLHQFVPDVQSQGEIAVQISGGGTTSQPSIRGQLEIRNAAFSSEGFPASIQGLSGAIALNGNRAVITNLSGSVGGGKIAASGSVDLGRETRFALALNAQSVRIRYPQGLRSVLDAQLNAQGTPRGSSVVGRLTVNSLSFTQGFDFATFLASLSEESSGAAPSPFQEKVKLNVAVQSAPNLSLASSRLSIGGAANLDIIGTVANPVVLGRVGLSSGEIFYLGKRFELQNGTIEFANPARTDPVLNLNITTNIEQYDITLKLSGPMDRLRTSYTSDPSMSQADIIHLLAFGNTNAEAASQTPASASQNAEAVLAQGVSSPLTGKLQSLTGISQLSIDPLATNAYGDPGTQIAVQQRVTGSILFTFSTNVTTTQSQTASLRYDVSKRLSVTVLRDQNGGYGVDVRLHKAF